MDPYELSHLSVSLHGSVDYSSDIEEYILESVELLSVLCSVSLHESAVLKDWLSDQNIVSLL
jgi:hypothetical protein